jgi:uncharacterized protein YjdB
LKYELRSKTEWKQLKGTFTIVESGTVTGTRLFMYTDIPNVADTFYVDDFSLNEITSVPGPGWTYTTGISIPSALSLYAGYSEKVVPVFSPSGAFLKDLVWSSSDPSAAIVDVSGVVYGRSAGTTVIQATSLDGGYTAQSVVEVTYRVPVSGITLDRSALTLQVGQNGSLLTTLMPLDASDQRVNWSSANPAIAEVDAYGNISALQMGTTTVTARTVDGSFIASTVITVNTNKTLGSNLVVDPGMEDNTLHYSGYNIAQELTITEARSGLQSQKVTKGSSTANIGFPATISKGDEYYYAAWVKLAPGATAGEVLRICLQYKEDGVIKQKLILTGPTLSLTEWKKAEGFYTIDEVGTVTEVKMYMYTDLPGLADSYYLDDVEIRKVL